MASKIINRLLTDEIHLHDGTRISFYHSQDCCEDVYADISQLADMGFETDATINRDNLHFELIEGYGIRLNGYGIPCYNIQNGYYSSDIRVRIEFEFDTDVYGHTELA